MLGTDVAGESVLEDDGKPLSFRSDAETAWREWLDESVPDGSCLRSGSISTNDESALLVQVSGAGRLSFDWKISAGRGDTCAFVLDGVETNVIQRSSAWKSVSVDLGAGDHVLQWIYRRGTGSASGSDAAFLDNVNWRPRVLLAVSSAFGTPDPARGTHALVYGDSVAASVAEPEPETGVRRVFTGWTGTGSVPTSGTTPAVSFAITNDSSLAWNWRTDYRMSLAVEGPVTADFSDGWVAEGTTKVVNWTPSVPYFDVAVSGDTAGGYSWSEGVALDRDARTLSIPANRARNVTLEVTERVVDFSAVGPVTTDFAEVWGEDADELTVHWEPTVPYFRVSLSGDTSGVSLDEDSKTLTIPTSRSRTFSLVVEELTLERALDTVGLAWTTDGAAVWFPQISVHTDGEDAAQSGAMANGDEWSGLETKLDGPGTLTWTWRISSAGNAGVDVLLDDEWLEGRTPGLDWSEEELVVSGEGEHVVRFEFWNASGNTDVRAWIDQVLWIGRGPVGGLVRLVSADRTNAVLATVAYAGDGSVAVTRTLETATDEDFANVVRSVALGAVVATEAGNASTGLLEADTDYWTRLRLSRTGFDDVVSEPVSFRTLPHTSPALGTAAAEDVTARSATVAMRLDALGSDGGAVMLSLAVTNLAQGRAVAALSRTVTEPGKTTRFDLTGLSASTVYRFIATARSVATGLETSVSGGFTTDWAETPRIAAGGSGSSERPALCFLPSESGTGEDFVIRIDNPIPGLWYPVYTNGTPGGRFAVQSCGKPTSGEGGYIVRVPAVESALFVKIGVSETYLASGMVEGTVIDPFAAALDCANLSFETGGNADWFVQETDVHEGGSALRSGRIMHSQNTWLETTVEGPGTLSFWWKVSSESVSYDYVEVLVDGTQKAKIGGTGGNWARVELSIEGDGTHTVRWNYRKDDFASSGSDCAWLDAVTWASRGSYTIRFLPNGGSGTMADQSAPLDCTVSLSRNGFSRDGFVFAGWSDSPTGDALYSNGAEVVNLANDPGGVATLYALWRERGGAAGLAIAYYDTSSSSFSTYSAMTSFFSSRTPTLEASTIDFGDTLDSAITGMSSSDVSRISNTGFRSFYSTTSASSGRLHGKYANGSQNSFCAHASGTIYLATAGTYSFGLAGDDGAVLYIDGTKVCSASWGSEGTGTIALTAGDHDLDLAFYEGSGGQGFLVQWKRPADSVWSPLPQNVLSH